MINYYIVLESRSHAFLLERRMKDNGIKCEISFVPRNVVSEKTSMCNMGIKFDECVLAEALGILRHCGLPGCRLYSETILPDNLVCNEVDI